METASRVESSAPSVLEVRLQSPADAALSLPSPDSLDHHVAGSSSVRANTKSTRAAPRHTVASISPYIARRNSNLNLARSPPLRLPEQYARGQLEDVSVSETSADDDGRANSPQHPSASEKQTSSNDKVLLKRLGVDKNAVLREKGLKKLGLTEDMFEEAREVFKADPLALGELRRKQERLSGYSLEQMRRAKALQKLGTTEEYIQELRAKRLSDVGTSYARTSSLPI